jgi:twitching motility protein PilI
MAKRISLREFQARLSERLTSARRSNTALALLGIVSGRDTFLIDLYDSGEVLPLPPLTTVPLTKPWYAGVANVRGALYSVVDFSAFRGGEPTPRNNDARLLLVGARYGVNSALLVNRTLGLKNPSQLQEQTALESMSSWAGGRYTDADSQTWIRLNVKLLLDDPEFLNIAV